MSITKNIYGGDEFHTSLVRVLMRMFWRLPLDESGNIKTPFAGFPAGTSRDTVGTWIMRGSYTDLNYMDFRERPHYVDWQHKLSDVLSAFCLAYITPALNASPSDPRIRHHVWLDTARNAQANVKAEGGLYDALAFHYTVRLSVPDTDKRDIAPLTSPCSKGVGQGERTMRAVRAELGKQYNVSIDKTHAWWLQHGKLPWEIAQARSIDHRKLAPTPMEAMYWFAQEGFYAHGQSFSQWAREFDYSDDSIKAKAIYETCVAHYDGLVRLFGYSAITQLEQDWNAAENDI